MILVIALVGVSLTNNITVVKQVCYMKVEWNFLVIFVLDRQMLVYYLCW